jgi:transcription termination factor Rho
MTERSTLERKRLSDLHQIASQLGIKQYRKYRKPELAEMIYKVATEQAASQQNDTATNGGAAATATQEAPVTTEGPNGATETTVAAPVDGFGEADTNLATTEQIERQERGRRDRKIGQKRYGVNRSKTHIDVMIGTDALNADGITQAGKRVPLVTDGTWQF